MTRIPGTGVPFASGRNPSGPARSAGLLDDVEVDRTSATTVGTGVMALLLAIAAGAFALAASPAEPSVASVTVQTCAIFMAAGVGLLIGVRKPGHPMGLLLCVAAALFAVSTFAEAYGRYVVLAGHDLPLGLWAVLWANASWPVMFAGVAAIAFVFPDGKLLSRQWRTVAWVAAASILGVIVLSLFSHEGFDEPFQRVDNPLPRPPQLLAILEPPFLLAMVGSLIAAGLAARARFVRSEGLQRHQLLWFACSAWLIPVTLLVCFADLVVPADLDPLVIGLLLATVIAVPASIGVAILRWRLYEIDRFVNRALVYGVLTGCVIALYTAVVLTVGRFAQDRGSLPVSLVGTGVAVVAVLPLRGLLQRFVDRLLYGDRRDPYAGLSRLAARLEDSIAPQTALRTIVDTVAGSLRAPFVAIDLLGPAGRDRAAVHGEPRGRGTLEVPLVFQGEAVGELVVESRGPDAPFNSADRRLLDDLARHAGPVVHAIRLTTELQRSRERLVTAQEEERRRIRRDLHDGLGPVLANAVFQVDAARDAIDSAPRSADQQLDELRSTLQSAVADIRGLVYALRPAALDELGLVPALDEEIARFNSHGSGPHISLRATGPLPSLPAAVEVAAYRIALEAMTNAVRHSGAGACFVTLNVNGGLELDVTDDGDGPTAGRYAAGVGISSMKERASELGGVLRVEQLPGGGTSVHAMLPLDLR